MIEATNTGLAMAIIGTVGIGLHYFVGTPWFKWRLRRPSMYMSISDPRFRGAYAKWRHSRPGRK